MTTCITEDLGAVTVRVAVLEALYASAGNPPLKGDQGIPGPAGVLGANTGIVTTGSTVSPAQSVTPIAADAAVGTNQPLFLLTAPTGYINGLGGNDAVQAQSFMKVTPFGTGADKYFCMSYTTNGLNNQFGSNNPVNPAIASTYEYIEAKFTQDPLVHTYYTEWHFAHRTTTLPFADKRFMDFTLPHSDDSATADATVAWRLNQYYFFDWTGSLKFNISFRGAASGIDIVYYEECKHAFTVGNVPIMTQYGTVAGYQLNLPYISNRDEYLIGQPTYISAVPQTNLFGLKAFQTALVSGLGGIATYYHNYATFNGASVTGTAFAQRLDFNASVKLDDVASNLHATGQNIRRLDSVAGDVLRAFRVTGAAKSWTYGLNTADSNSFVVGRGNAVVSATPDLRIDQTTGQVSFPATPPKMPGFTKAQLTTLTPATAGAGAFAFCTDLTGGAGPVYSDGATWRRFIDATAMS